MTDTTTPVPLASGVRTVPSVRALLGGRVSSGVRRNLQTVLAGIWLLDGILQFQPAMFTKNFAQMVIYPTIAGNPGAIASPMNWAQKIILDHPVGTNTAFACIQLALGLAIAYRPTAKLGLAASIPWSIAVWWFGEGLGGVLSGNPSPLAGAPGAVILYALLAMLLWPVDDEAPTPPFPAARPVGAHAARALWLVLWGSLAYLAVAPGNTGADAVQSQITGMVDGQPGWLASIMNHAADLTAGRGTEFLIVLAVLLGAIAVSVYVPSPQVRRAAVILAFVVAAVIWVIAEAFGGVFQGMGTDPNTGPLLALIAAAYWPTRGVVRARAGAAVDAAVDADVSAEVGEGGRG